MTSKFTFGLLVVAVLSSMAALCGQDHSTHPKSYSGPRCIVEFCFDGDHQILETEFVSRYSNPTKSDGVSCYRVPDQGVFVRFDSTVENPAVIDEVFVSARPNCLRTFSKTVSPKLKFKRFITPEGITLADTESKVERTDGRPTELESGTGLDLRGLDYNKALKSAPFGDKVLWYSGAEDDLLLNLAK